jgi:hypothetical protein
MQLQSLSKLAYYPTIMEEVYRMLPFFGKIQKRDGESIKKFIGEEKYAQIFQEYGQYEYVRDAHLFMAVCNKSKFAWQKARDWFYYSIYYNGDYNSKILVADFFAGKGEWLNFWKDIFPKEVETLGVEPEEERYKEMKRKATYSFNVPFEELDIPNKSVSIMLFNPPYGNSFGSERQVEYFYDMMMSRNLFVDCNNDTSSYYGKAAVMITVLNTKDTQLLLQKMIRDFDNIALYRVEDEEEFSKFNQFVGIWRKREHPLSEMMIEYILDKTDILNAKINRQAKFNPMWFNNSKIYFHTSKNFNDRLDNHVFKKTAHLYKSAPTSNATRWAKSLTGINLETFNRLNVPKEPTPSEISLFLSSGTLDGEVTRTEGTHIITAGVKTEVTEKQEIEIDDETGDEVTVTRKIIASKPYLNILYGDDQGKLHIKEI